MSMHIDSTAILVVSIVMSLCNGLDCPVPCATSFSAWRFTSSSLDIYAGVCSAYQLAHTAPVPARAGVD